MDVEKALERGPLLMEGALGERLKREFHLPPDETVALAAHVYSTAGRDALEALWQGYLQVAREEGLPLLACTPTRRADRDRAVGSPWGEGILADNVSFLREVAAGAPDLLVAALVGCRGDAYTAAGAMGTREARRYHWWAAERLAAAGAGMFFAGIMPALPEAAGMAQALSDTGLPYIISFMVSPYGRLPDGTAIHDAIARIDGAAENPPLCYMANCVHPDVLHRALGWEKNRTALVRRRFWGIQANASSLSPGVLDGAETLHADNPETLAAAVARLGEYIPLRIAGGCCGTDEGHLRAIAGAVRRLNAPAALGGSNTPQYPPVPRNGGG